MKKIFICITILGLYSSQLLATVHQSKGGLFSVDISDKANPAFGNNSPETVFGTSMVAFLDQMEAGIPKPMLDSVDKSLVYMADSQSGATRGLGTTYATNQSLFIISASMSAGANPGKKSIMDVINNPNSIMPPGGIPEVGAGAQTSIVLGFSLKQFDIKPLGFFNPSGLTFFVNYFTISGAALGALMPSPLLKDVKMDSIGFHVQYKLIKEVNIGGKGLLHWGGLDITTGIDVTTNSIGMPLSTLIKPMSQGALPGPVLTFNPSGNLSFTNTAVTVPIEASTSIRLAYLLSFIAGGAVDLNMGNSNIDLGKINITGESPLGKGDVGVLQINGKKKNATAADLRFFFGPQINLVPLASGKNILSLSVIASISTGNTYGVHVGLNAGF